MRRFDIVTIGSAVKDLMFFSDAGTLAKGADYPTWSFAFDEKIRSEHVATGFGGGASNTAVNLANLGLRTSAIISVGDDEDGEMFLESLRRKGIDVSRAQIQPNLRTGFSFLLIHEKTREHIAFTHFGATEALSGKLEAYRKIKTAWWYLAPIHAPNWKAILRAILQQPGKFAWNPSRVQIAAGYRAMAPFLKHMDVLLLNRQEALELAASHPKYSPTLAKTFSGTSGGKALVRFIHSWGPGIVIITNSRGSLFAQCGEDVYNRKPPQDKPVDTTGAGDCFGSTFVAAYYLTGDMDKALRAAVANTTSVVHTMGAQAGFLTWPEIVKNAKL